VLLLFLQLTLFTSWEVTLDPLEAGSLGSIKFIKDNYLVILSDVLVGEVWLCPGQSNMQIAVGQLGELTSWG